MFHPRALSFTSPFSLEELITLHPYVLPIENLLLSCFTMARSFSLFNRRTSPPFTTHQPLAVLDFKRPRLIQGHAFTVEDMASSIYLPCIICDKVIYFVTAIYYIFSIPVSSYHFSGWSESLRYLLRSKSEVCLSFAITTFDANPTCSSRIPTEILRMFQNCNINDGQTP